MVWRCQRDVGREHEQGGRSGERGSAHERSPPELGLVQRVFQMNEEERGSERLKGSKVSILARGQNPTVTMDVVPANWTQ